MQKNLDILGGKEIHNHRELTQTSDNLHEQHSSTGFFDSTH